MDQIKGIAIKVADEGIIEIAVSLLKKYKSDYSHVERIWISEIIAPEITHELLDLQELKYLLLNQEVQVDVEEKDENGIWRGKIEVI